MPRVKVLFITNTESDDFYGKQYLTKGTEWEEVSDEDATLLNKWRYEIPTPQGLRAIIVQEDTVPVSEHLDSAKAWLAQENDRRKTQLVKARNAAKIRKAKALERKKVQLAKLTEELKGL